MDLFQPAILVLSLSVPWLIVSLASGATGAARVLMALGAWPLVVVAESLLLIAWPGAGVAVLVFHLACLALACVIGRARPRFAPETIKDLLGPAVATCLVGVPLVFLWFADAELRAFGWHHLLQLEAIYSAFENGGIDLGYAGKEISYPFLGLLPLAEASRVLDLSPTLAYPVLNILSLFVWAGSLHLWLRTISPDAGRFQGALGIAFLMLASGALVYLATLLLQESGLYIYIENRTVPLIAKHRHIDAMALGLMSLSLQYLCVLLQGRGQEGFRVLETWFGVQACVTYPALGPVAILFSGMMAVRTALPALRVRPFASLEAFVSPMVVALSLLLTMAYLGADKTGSGLGLLVEPKRLVIGVANVGLSLGLTGVLAWYGIRKQPRIDRILILLTLLCLAVLFVLLKLPADIQYKFLYGANVLLLFHGAGVLVSSRSRDAALSAGSWVLPGLAAASVLLVTVQLADRRPKMVDMPVMDQRAFLVRSELGASIETILAKHRIDRQAVVMVSDVQEPVVPFTRIAQYFYMGPVQVGYSMDPAFIVTSVKGYDAQEHEARRRAIEAMLAQCAALPHNLRQDLDGRTIVFLLAAPNPCLAGRHEEHRLPGGSYLYLEAPYILRSRQH